ncbi:MAG TPA: MBL fold metallo-hydrolase [Candidatus Methylomirabilis sp.]|nr:MBL fold metallo-hydrolase [Candidatus Methylomirabilis sp.]
MLEYRGIQITWLGHDGFKFKKDRVIYVDPFKLGSKVEPGDLVCVTHEHFDHLSLDDLKKVVTVKTTLLISAACQEAVKGLRPKSVRVVRPGDNLDVNGVGVEVLPAYNVNKFRSPGNPFHPRTGGMLGFLLTIDGVRIYHAGDTDQIPEMSRAKGVDVALLPVSGTYVMTPEEAIQACKALQPALALPMHYGAIVGSEADAEAFKQGVTCRVEILLPEH